MAKFSSNGGHFGYLHFSKYVLSNIFNYFVCRKGFWRNNYLFHGINIEKWPFFVNFGPFWVILGHFGPFLGTQNFLNFAPCIILSLVTFSHQLSCINIVLNAFFKSFYSEIVNFELNWGFQRGQFLLVQFFGPKPPETCL